MRLNQQSRVWVMIKLLIALLLLAIFLGTLPAFIETSLGQGFALIWGTFLFVILLAQITAYRLIQKRKEAEDLLKKLRAKRHKKRFQRANFLP